MTTQVSNQEKIKRSEIVQEKGQKIFESQEQVEQSNLRTDTGEVSDFMDGLDVPTPSEKISEGVREDDKKQKGSQTKKQRSDDDFSFSAVAPLKLPPQRIMVRRIRRELHREIKVLMKQAKREEKKGAFYLTQILEKIRDLKGTLSSLATATFEVIKSLYVSLFDKKKTE